MKIYNEVILQWNDKTNQFDTVYEDSYDHDGPIAELMADDMEFETSRDLLDEINNDLKRAQAGTNDWSKAQMKLNQNLGTFASELEKSGKLTEDLKNGIVGLRTGIVDAIALETQLGNMKADLAAKQDAAFQAEAAYMEARERGDLEATKAARAKVVETRNLVKEGEEAVEGQQDLVDVAKDYEKAKAQAAALQQLDNDLLGGMGSQVMDLVKNFGSVLGVLAVIGMVIAGISAITQDIGDNFGALGIEHAYASMVDLRTEAVFLGYEFDEAAGAVTELTSQLGISNSAAAGLAQTTLDTARALAMSPTEAATLQSIIANVTSTSAEGANNFMKQAAMLAQASDVAPNDILNDMSESSNEIAKYTDSTGDNMVRAAIRAKQLGMSLSDVAGIADGLLDFQTSLSNEIEASVMLGRPINLQRARELALAGDLVGMTDEILNNVVSEAEWTELNALERQALADAVGVEVSQMSRLVKEAGKSTKEISSMRKMDVGELVGKKAMSRLNQVINWVKWLGAVALGAVAKWLDKMDWFGLSTGLESSAEILEDWVTNKLSAIYSWWQETKKEIYAMRDAALSVGETLGEWLLYLGQNETLLKTLASLWVANKLGITTFVGAAVQGLTTYIAKLWAAKAAKDAMNTGGDLTGGTKGLGKSAGNMLAGAAAMFIMAGALLLMAFALQQFANVNLEQVGLGLLALGGLALVAWALGTASPAMITGATAVLILAAAVAVLALAFIGFGVGAMLFVPFIAAMAEHGLAAAGAMLAMAGGFAAMVIPLGAFALAGLFAIPAMNKVIEFDQALHGEFQKKSVGSKKSPEARMDSRFKSLESKLGQVETAINKLVTGWGVDKQGASGEIPKAIGKAFPNPIRVAKSN